MPGTMWWIHTRVSSISVYRYTRRSKYRPGPIPCRVAYLTHKHNTADPTQQTSRLSASSEDCSMWLLPASSRRARTIPLRVPTVPMWVRLVPDVSSHSTRFGSPCVLRKADAATQRIHAGVQSTPCGYRWHCMKALGVPYPNRLQYPCEYSEYHLSTRSAHVSAPVPAWYSKCPCEYSECSSTWRTRCEPAAR
jgi:hypothetical protein